MNSYCTSCGEALVVGASFCGQCGVPVPATSAFAEPARSYGTPPTATAYVSGAPTLAQPAAAATYAPWEEPVGGRSRGRTGDRGVVGAWIGFAGAALVVAGSLLSWWAHATWTQSNAFRVPFGALVNDWNEPSTKSGIGVLLVTIAVVGAALSFVPRAGFVRNICGALVVIVVVVYLIQLQRSLHAAETFGHQTLFDFIGPGIYVTGVGALMMAVAPPRR